MKILFLESFHGGSHRDFALACQHYSSHEIKLLTLPARHWKWRQGGSTIAFCGMMEERGESFDDYDRLVVTDLTDLNLLKSLRPLPPVLLYMHESQFHYPLGEGETADYHYGLKDFTNMLTADSVVFNSRYHGETFFKECRRFLSLMPDFRPTSFLDELQMNWHVVYPGFTPPPYRNEKRKRGAPVIIWNHRWEHDKNPEDFHAFLRELREKDQPFRLRLLGERFRRYPPVFDKIIEEFSDKLISADYADSREAYWDALFQADYVISTSRQENFGISIVEAVRAGAVPLLPNRLSYPEVLPREYHHLLCDSVEDMVRRFLELEEHPLPDRDRLARAMEPYTHEKTAAALDQLLENMA